MTYQRSAELLEYEREMVTADWLRPGSIVKRMSVLVRCEMALGRPLIEASTLDLRGWLDGHTLNAKTRYSYISHLSSFWRWAITDERIERDPTVRITRPRMRQDLPRPISREAFAMVIDQAPTAEIRAMLTIGGYAGLRCMEISGLQAGDVMEHAEPPVLVVNHGKGDKPRVVPMSTAIVDALKAYGIPRSGPVFTDGYGQARRPSWVSHTLRNHMHECGLEASAHQLRHTFGTEVYRRSHDLRMTQQLLGHSSPATTAGYCAWSQDLAAGVVATLFT
jgi:site-specific recombinase XerD